MAGTRTDPWVKDPNDVEQFGINWVPKLATGDALATSVWSVVSGTVVIDTNTSNSTHALVTLSGGTLGERCVLLNRVTTSLNKTRDRTCYVKIRAQ